MNVDILNMADMAVSNGILVWLGLRLVKRVDDLDKRVDDHETRISLTERGAQHGR